MINAAVVRGIPSAMNWSTMIQDWDAWLRAANRPKTTRGLRMAHLRRFARDHADPGMVTTLDLATWLGSHGWAAETMRAYRASLRSFFSYAVAVGLLPADPAAALPAIRPPVHPGEAGAGRRLAGRAADG